MEQGGTDSTSNVPINLRIFASYLLVKFLYFGEHPETTPYRPTYSTVHTVTTTQRSMLAAAAAALPLPAYCCGRILLATRGRVPLLEGHVRGRDRLHRESSEAVTSAVSQGVRLGRVHARVYSYGLHIVRRSAAR